MLNNLKCSNIDFDALRRLPIRAHLYWKNREGFYLGSNDLLLETLGFSSQKDFIGAQDTDFSIPEGNGYWQDDMHVIHSGQSMQFYNYMTLPKRRIKFLTIKTPIFDQDKKVTGTFGFSQYLAEYSLDQCASDPNFILSKRERDCLFHLVQGRTAKEIANLLFISKRTVEKHIINIKEKLDCSSKSELVAKSIQHGLITITQTGC